MRIRKLCLFLPLLFLLSIQGVASDNMSDGGQQFKAPLVRISDLEPSVQAVFPSIGSDSLLRGTVEVDSEDNDVRFDLEGASADSTYTLVFCSFATGTTDCLAIGSFSTNGQGNAEGALFFPQLGTFAGIFVLKRDGLSQFASGFALPPTDSSNEGLEAFKASLQRATSVTAGLGSGFVPVGEDSLLSGNIQLERSREMQVELKGAAVNSTYAVHFCRFLLGPSDCVLVGAFTTDTEGKGEGQFDFPSPPAPGTFAGVFVLRRTVGGQETNQFVTGFRSLPSLGPVAKTESEMGLVRINQLEVSAQSTFPEFGNDTLIQGAVDVEGSDNKVEVEVEGALATATYTVNFCPIATAECFALGPLTTDGQGNGEGVFSFSEEGVFAGIFVLAREGDQFVSGFDLPAPTGNDNAKEVFEAKLLRVEAVPGGRGLGSGFILGTDPLGKGKVQVEQNREVEVELKGAATNGIYAVHFCRFGMGPGGCFLVGSLPTDGEGNGGGQFSFPSPPPPGSFAGVFVLRRTVGGQETNQFVTGFEIANRNGVVNGASYATGTAVAPGSIVSIFGSNIASDSESADSIPLPESLAGASLHFNSTLVGAIFFASPFQLNMQIPWELAGQEEALLTVTVGGLTSSPTRVALTPFSPGLFSTSANGSGQGSILISDTPFVAAPEGAIPGRSSRPARRGEESISIFATGLGAVTNPPPTGLPPSTAQLSETTTTPTVTIGGVPASTTFSGLAPCCVGLYQVNVSVPATAPIGDAIPVVLTIGGMTSNTVTIAVR